MNRRIISVIIGREYMTRIKKKSFLLITFLGPIFFAAIVLLPSLIMLMTKEDAKKVAVVDQSGIALPFLKDDNTVAYSDFSSMNPDSVKTKMENLGMDAVLHISPLERDAKTVSVASYSKKPLGMDLQAKIERAVNDAVEDYRVKSYSIEDLDKIMADVKSDIKMSTYTVGEDGKDKITVSEVYMMISMGLGIIIYMFIAMFSGMVMTSVIEEKSSRVVEVLVSSVKSTELMFGKIIGVAMVALTQFLLWIILTIVVLALAGGIFGTSFLSSGAASMPGTGMPGMDMSQAVGSQSDMAAFVTTLAGLDYIQILTGFFVYFILGYLLYASLFAAIGSAVENEGDTQQLAIPVTMPLMIGFFISIYAFKAPDSGLVFWGSMIPFTSPIVMIARIPFGVPLWQLALSFALLAGTFILCAWASAKIYKIGILMFGKKTTFKDLWKWLKQK